MQRLLKFTSSPNGGRRADNHQQTASSNRQSVKSLVVLDPSSVEDSTRLVVDGGGELLPCRELCDKVKSFTFCPPLNHHHHHRHDQQDHYHQEAAAGGGNSSEPSSPRPSAPAPPTNGHHVTTTTSSSCVSPPAATVASHSMALSACTPGRSRRMAFFNNNNSNRFSLDEYSGGNNHHHNKSTLAGGGGGGGGGSVADMTSMVNSSTPPTTPHPGSPAVTPPTHHRRAAVHLASSPIRLLSPKVSGLAGGGAGLAAQMTNFGDLEYMNTSNEGYRLTVEQRELVRKAWRNSNPERGGGSASSTAGAWIFKRIFAHHPHLKRLFNLHELEDERLLDADPQFQKHAKVFTDVLEMIVECADALDDCLGPLLLSYGSKHVNFESGGHGFRPDYWDSFALAMAEYATNNWKFIKNRAESLRAWRILVFFTVSKVKQGFVLEKKAREKKGLMQQESFGNGE